MMTVDRPYPGATGPAMRAVHDDEDSLRAESVANICRGALRKGWIPHEARLITVSPRVVYAEGLETDRVGPVGVGIEVYLPRQRERVSQVIAGEFKEHWIPTQGPGQTGLSTKYSVTLKDEFDWPRKVVEIHVVPGLGDWTFQTEHDLGVSLLRWTSLESNDGGHGDVVPLWKLLECLDLCQARTFISENLDIPGAPEEDYARKAERFRPLKLSLAMYLTDSVMRSARAQRKIGELDGFRKNQPVAQQQRIKIEILRDSFIWLDRLLSWGQGAARVFFDGVDKAMEDEHKERIRCLDDSPTKTFFKHPKRPLAEEDATKLEELWRFFSTHRQLLIQYVFSLAKLGVQDNRQPSWHRFRQAIQDLVYHDRKPPVDDGCV